MKISLAFGHNSVGRCALALALLVATNGCLPLVAQAAPVAADDPATATDANTPPVVADPVFVGTYKLLARHSKRALTVEGQSQEIGANVQQLDDLNQTNQRWIITETEDGYSKLVAAHSGKALDVSGGETVNRANVRQWNPNGSKAQQWEIESVGEGYYKLTNRNSEKVLEVESAPDETSNGANVQQWEYIGGANQQWSLEKISDATAPAIESTPAPAPPEITE